LSRPVEARWPSGIKTDQWPANHDAAGINYDLAGPHSEKDNPRTANDVKDAQQLLITFSDDHLKQSPILPAGARLEQDATYIDLADPDRKEFKALAACRGDPRVGIRLIDHAVQLMAVDRVLGERPADRRKIRLGKVEDKPRQEGAERGVQLVAHAGLQVPEERREIGAMPPLILGVVGAMTSRTAATTTSSSGIRARVLEIKVSETTARSISASVLSAR
jgi:hypothetical protein